MRIDTTILSTAFRYFLAVADAGSIRAAARELNIVSSAVNRQILLLEENLGIRLFDRVGRGLRLSEAGTLLARQVRETLDRYDDVVSELDTLRGLRRGRIRIATVESISVERLPDLLAEYWHRHPGIEVVLTVAGADEVTRRVDEGQADVGFTFSTHPLEGLRLVHEETHPVGALMAAGHPLADRVTLSFHDLIEEPLVLPARGMSLRTAVEPLLAARRRDLKVRAELNSLRLMSALVRRSRSVGFLTNVGFERELRSGELVWKPLTDEELVADRLMVISRIGTIPGLAVAAFTDLIEEIWGVSLPRE
ncbi:LysR family transcriptional regulator [Pinisolibacter aquiterrae]|uniref:LysR family transcriptional regulator n=1 Tax=Pinisolibacter aquiterrae TaxID=2815579 RepID=UPI001C3DA67B|nr:LysR family transcriptional regulator [Pinisolibacter aquiterrae]MCC8234939.1 LysR family transcriptional regulator [Pinisolibacter aquiterrae]